MADTYPIEFAFPDLGRWEHGGAAPWVHVRDSGVPGPTVMVNALTHGNEASGAVVVDALLARDLKPRTGILILGFANVAAYRTFDIAQPFKSRMIEEDLNRVWRRLDDPASPRTVEFRRALELRPFVERADLLLDLHSMHDECVPLMLCGPLEKGVDFARRIGTPFDIVRDKGHPSGRRMRDHGGFGDPDSPKNALLIETGQHWRASSVTVAKDTTFRFLVESGVVEATDLPPDWRRPSPPAQRVVHVTDTVTTSTGMFRFARPWGGQDTIPSAGSLLGHDGERAVYTPYDDCVLVMPAHHRVRPGVTAVRLGRVVG